MTVALRRASVYSAEHMTPDAVRRIVSDNLTNEEIESLDGAVVLDPPSLDVAIVGWMLNEAGERVVVYDYLLLVSQFAADMGDGSEEEDALEAAEEWVQYNTIRALPYMGTSAPVILEALDDDDLGEADGEDEPVLFQNRRWYRHK
jgi:hypothetical protein